MLTEEYGTAKKIKSRVNRLSVLSAITTTQYKLKLYKHIPPNGLIIYSGTMLMEDGKEKKVNIDFEPFKPMHKSLYKCDNKFHTDLLTQLLDTAELYGFIIMDGNGCLYATLEGDNKSILRKFTVELPKKHSSGGQSALRFSRLREEARHNYLKKCAEMAIECFITDNKCNVKGLIVAGSAQFKEVLVDSSIFSPILKDKILKVYDISYGMESGLKAAIELSSDTLSNVKLVQEKKLLQFFFEEIAQDTDKYSYSVNETIKALEMDAIETLIIWDNSDISRIVIKDLDNQEKVLYLTPLQEKNMNLKVDIISRENIIEWLISNYKTFGIKLEFVTNRTHEGIQFCDGFGGIGGLLRWKVNLMELEDLDNFNDLEEDIEELYEDYI